MRSANQVLMLLIAFASALLCASCGPHMINQRSIKPYEQQMPKVPVGIVPTGGRLQAYTAQQITTAKNPLPSTPANISNGRIYYGYYCLMCHGEKGDGNGPVGESYVPKPTDLSSPTVTSLNDGKLYQAMLHGLGHDPVMDETVQPEQRWPLVMYIRTFAKAAP